MISGRCTLLSTIRYVSEVYKKRYHGNRKCAYLIDGGFLSKGSGFRVHKESYKLGLLSLKMASTSSAKSSGPDEVVGTGKNRLALERSPYLLQHASNPVQWYPWGEEAFEKARKEMKPIFLSVGYSTCHWCHVMERESFENKEIATIMNKYFVSIKVDKEERPDIDRIYMTFIQVVTGHGGWPMSVFLTPDLMPISGGTYFPPENKHGQIGFKVILLKVATMWDKHKYDIIASSTDKLSGLQQFAGCRDLSTDDTFSVESSTRKCTHELSKSFDSEYGGFMDAPKFPQPVFFNFLFHMYARVPRDHHAEHCLEMCLHTLRKIAHGGIHDHVGQGFSRYSVDKYWHVPHFEKMLYDQAQLMRAYAEAYVASKEQYFADIVDDIATYVTRDLRHKEGGFYSAEDADSLPKSTSKEKREGAFYTWTYDEITTLLDKPIPQGKQPRLSDLFIFHFHVKREGNVDPRVDAHNELRGQNVLIVHGSLEDTAEHFGLTVEVARNYLKEACDILYEERSKRPRPHLDDKIVAAWNGLMLSAFARSACTLDNKNYEEVATQCAKFIEKYLFDKSKNVLYRNCYRDKSDEIVQISVPICGFDNDYAFVVRGLLDLYEVTFDMHWLEFAEQLQDIQNSLFWDEEDGGYFIMTKEDPSVIIRFKENNDGAEPSSSSVSCGNLLRLAAYLDRSDYVEKAEKTVRYFLSRFGRMPQILAEMLSSAMILRDGVTQICIIGKSDDEKTIDLLRVVHERLIPGRVLILRDPENTDNIVCRKNEVIGRMKLQNGVPTAYVCRHHTCSLPVTTPEQLTALLEDEQ